MRILGMIFAALLFSLNLQALCVTYKHINLRSGPGTKYLKTWEVLKYMPLRKLKKRGNWYQVKDVDGMKHWVYRKLVTRKYYCAVVKVPKANLRTGPGTQYKRSRKLPEAIRYTSFKLLKTKGKWAHIQDSYGYKFWVYRPLIWVN